MAILVLLRELYQRIVSILRSMIGYFLSYLDSALRFCSSGIVDDMDDTDRRKEQDIQKELAQRRQKVADGLALIGNQQGLKIPNVGIKAVVDKDRELASPDLKARCFCDAPLASSQRMDISALPMIQGRRETGGLLVRLVDGTRSDYQRIGMFRFENEQLRKFSHISKEEQFFLI